MDNSKILEDKAWSAMAEILEKELPKKKKNRKWIILLFTFFAVIAFTIWHFAPRTTLSEEQVGYATASIDNSVKKNTSNFQPSITSNDSKTNSDNNIRSNDQEEDIFTEKESRNFNTNNNSRSTANARKEKSNNNYATLLIGKKNTQFTNEEIENATAAIQPVMESKNIPKRKELNISPLLSSRFQLIETQDFYTPTFSEIKPLHREVNSDLVLGVHTTSTSPTRIEGIGISANKYFGNSRLLQPYVGLGMEHYKFNASTLENSLTQDYASKFEAEPVGGIEDFNNGKIQLENDEVRKLSAVNLVLNCGFRTYIYNNLFVENEIGFSYDLHTASNSGLDAGDISNEGTNPFNIAKNKGIGVRSLHQLGYQINDKLSFQVGYLFQHRDEFNYSLERSEHQSSLRYNRFNIGAKLML